MGTGQPRHMSWSATLSTASGAVTQIMAIEPTITIGARRPADRYRIRWVSDLRTGR